MSSKAKIRQWAGRDISVLQISRRVRKKILEQERVTSLGLPGSLGT